MGGELEPALVAALKESDVILSVLELENTAIIDNYRFQEILNNGKMRCTSLLAVTAELLRSDWARFPAEIVSAIISKVIDQSKSGRDKSFRLTAPNGTDLQGVLDFRWGFKKAQFPWKWHYFPGADMAEHPRVAEGKLVFDHLEGFKGYLSTPIKMEIKNHVVSTVEGGFEARWLERMMKRFTNGNYFCEFTIGAHPKAPLLRGLEERAVDTLLFRHSGSFHGAVGRWGDEPDSGAPFSEWHWDGGILNPTLSIGGVTLVKNGRLAALDDEEVRKAASKYGDPDVVLEEAYWPDYRITYRKKGTK